ncbi:MAG: DeoR/GlpR family DNA-binding transcription regulator [Treponema sp.]|nr:DeoR/GlpR family DNA-binding transcription regulator [Treponema sp.]
MNRKVMILDILAAHRTVKVSMLIELLNVSHVTIRKDLDHLEKRGIIKRTHGYVSLDGADNTGKRMAFSHLIKRKIAKAAAQTVEEGETIMLESGSCCALFAEELAAVRNNVTIITNSTFIANFVCHLPNIKIILLGGYFQPDSQVVVGPMTTTCAESFFADKFFIGTNGFVPGQCFTGGDHLRVETAINLAKCANKVFILTEAAKFHQRGTFELIQLDKIAGVFTDENIPKEAEAALIKNNVMLKKVSATDKKLRWRYYPELPPILYYTENE